MELNSRDNSNNNSNSNSNTNSNTNSNSNSTHLSGQQSSKDSVPNSIVRAYLLPGMPQPLLTPEAHQGYGRLREAYNQVRAEIAASDADVILIYSEMWTSVIGHQIQALPEPSLVYVDEEFHDLGSIPYHFKIDSTLAMTLNSEAQKRGLHSRTVAYEGFPLDTGTVVALKLINPDNRIPAVVLSSNIYADQAETALLAQAGLAALASQGKKAIAVIISNLSKNMHTHFIHPKEDRIFSEVDEGRNRELLKLLEQGRLNDFIHQEHYNLKPFWWMAALLESQGVSFSGKTMEYAPIYGCGCAVVSMSENLLERPKNGIPKPSVKTPSSGHKIVTRRAPEPVGAYPHARRVGDLLFLSGVGPRKPGTKEIPGIVFGPQREVLEYDVVAQTESVIENIKIILEDSGASLENVVDVQVFLTNMKKDFAKFNEVYAKHFTSIGATRTTIEVGSLPTPIAVEFKVIATVGRV